MFCPKDMLTPRNSAHLNHNHIIMDIFFGLKTFSGEKSINFISHTTFKNTPVMSLPNLPSFICIVFHSGWYSFFPMQILHGALTYRSVCCVYIKYYMVIIFVLEHLQTLFLQNPMFLGQTSQMRILSFADVNNHWISSLSMISTSAIHHEQCKKLNTVSRSHQHHKVMTLDPLEQAFHLGLECGTWVEKASALKLDCLG